MSKIKDYYLDSAHELAKAMAQKLGTEVTPEMENGAITCVFTGVEADSIWDTEWVYKWFQGDGKVEK